MAYDETTNWVSGMDMFYTHLYPTRNS